VPSLCCSSITMDHTVAEGEATLPGHLAQQHAGFGTRRLLYVSHFLSMWNARGFEFGAVLFLATIYPGTLLPMSVYALLRAVAAIALAPLVGNYIDSADRLAVVRLSIVGQRLAVAASCTVFAVLFYGRGAMNDVIVVILLALLVLLACVEKPCSIMNTVAVERDWVVVMAAAEDSLLQEMNAQMRRIDLFCKLVSPLMIALLHGWSPNIAVATTFAVNVASVGLEYALIAIVFRKVPGLAERKSHVRDDDTVDDDGRSQSVLAPPGWSSGSKTWGMSLAPALRSLRVYSQQPAFLPSLALSLLYLTVLSFSGQMTTFLLALPSPKLTSTVVGLLRTASTVLEILATFIAPRVMSKIGPVRAGIWFLSWQMLCLSPAVGLLWTSVATSPTTAIPSFIVGVILSRVGLWSFDLCAQLIVQDSIESQYRGSFSATEAALQNFFELCTFATTIIFPRPAQFRYPALVSLAAVYLAAALYAKFVRDRRGHLLHMPPCLKTHQYERVANELDQE